MIGLPAWPHHVALTPYRLFTAAPSLREEQGAGRLAFACLLDWGTSLSSTSLARRDPFLAPKKEIDLPT